MDLDRVAQTSRWTAAARARESARPDRLFEDPLAGALAGPEGFALLDAEPTGASASPHIAIRTRVFDDWLLDVTRPGGPHQVVLLGAGMDTRAFRLPWTPGTSLWELDRPDLLALKSEILDRAGAQPRCDRRLVGVDLASSAWPERLVASGFDPAQPSAWLVEGFFAYLDEPVVEQVLATISSLAAPGSYLGTDFISEDFLSHPWMASYLRDLERRGTPWRFGTNQPEALLARHGWRAIARQPGEEGASFGRWPWPVAPREVPGFPRSFLVTASREERGQK